MGEFQRVLGEAIRQTRLARRLTLRELARRCGDVFRPSSIGGYERGERALSVERLVVLARALGMSADRILADALANADPRGHREMSLDIGRLPPGRAGDAAADHIQQIRAVRGDLATSIITCRSGDLQLIASAAEMTPEQTVAELGDAVLR